MNCNNSVYQRLSWRFDAYFYCCVQAEKIGRRAQEDGIHDVELVPHPEVGVMGEWSSGAAATLIDHDCGFHSNRVTPLQELHDIEVPLD